MRSFTDHARRRFSGPIPLLLALALATGCGDPTSPAPPTSAAPKDTPATARPDTTLPPARAVGSIRVSVATRGTTDLDPDGYVLVVDGKSIPVRINDTVEVGNLTVGSGYWLDVRGAASNCVVGLGWGGMIFVQPGGPTPVGVAVSCFPRSIPPAFATTRLLFVRDGQIYRARGDGSGLIALGKGADPAWSPDGQRIAFTRDSSLCVMDADGANARVIASGTHPAWSPDGSRLAFVSGASIAVVPADGSIAPVRIATATTVSRPAWSPDGSTITYQFLAWDGGWDDGSVGVSSVAPDGSNARRLTDDAPFGDPAWSPDGKRIVLAGSGGIAVMNADGSGLHVLSRFEGYTLPPVWSPAWSPDGQAIAFTVRTVARSGAASEPPSVFYVTADGTVGLLIENASSPSWHK